MRLVRCSGLTDAAGRQSSSSNALCTALIAFRSANILPARQTVFHLSLQNYQGGKGKLIDNDDDADYVDDG
jgi:hypothetical protein